MKGSRWKIYCWFAPASGGLLFRLLPPVADSVGTVADSVGTVLKKEGLIWIYISHLLIIKLKSTIKYRLIYIIITFRCKCLYHNGVLWLVPSSSFYCLSYGLNLLEGPPEPQPVEADPGGLFYQALNSSIMAILKYFTTTLSIHYRRRKLLSLMPCPSSSSRELNLGSERDWMTWQASNSTIVDSTLSAMVCLKTGYARDSLLRDREEALRPNIDFDSADWDHFQVRAQADHTIFAAEEPTCEKRTAKKAFPKPIRACCLCQMLLSLELLVSLGK